MTFLGCPYAHTGSLNGQWTRGENDELGIVILSNGQVQVKARCLNCGTKSGALPAAVSAEWADITTLPIFTVHDRRTDFPPCSVSGCEAGVTEEHHFAPRNTFGDEAGNWPTAHLCRPHHHEWHRRMSGYSWHRAWTP